MNATDIETKLANAISNEVPDVLDDILSKCETLNGNVFEISEHKSKPKQNNWLKSISATAAALAILVGVYLGIGQYQTAHAIDSVITLDVNPSVKLEVNKDVKVVSATGINEDGTAILDGMAQDGKKLNGKVLEEAVNELVYAMVEEGYLSNQSNSILVSVDNSDEEKSLEIKSQLLKSVGNALNEKGIDGAVLGQNGTVDEKTTGLAVQYGISESKANLIEKIIAKSPQFSFNDLAVLSINDLSLLAEKCIDEMHNFSMVGTPSGKGYVTSDNAIDNACSHANITIGDDVKIGTSIELEDGKLVYDVTVKIGNIEHDYVIDAKTGVILNWVSKAIQNINDSSDPGEVTSEVTNDVTDDLAGDVTDEVSDEVIDTVTGVIDEVTDDITDIVDTIIDGFAGIGTTSSEASAKQIEDSILNIITEKATGEAG